MITENSLIEEVEQLTEEVKRTHRYSMSRIYGLYNRVFDKQEQPQSCASCLIRKVRQLNEWLKAQKDANPEIEPQAKTRKRKKK